MESEAALSAHGDTVVALQGVKVLAHLPGLLVATSFKFQARRIQYGICDEIIRLANMHHITLVQHRIIADTARHAWGEYTIEITFETKPVSTDVAEALTSSLQEFVLNIPEREACRFHFDLDDGLSGDTRDHRLGVEDGMEIVALGLLLTAQDNAATASPNQEPILAA